MKNKFIYVKNAKNIINNIKNDIMLAKIIQKPTKEYYKGDI